MVQVLTAFFFGQPFNDKHGGDIILSNLFSQHECGYCVTENIIVKLADAFRYVINNEPYREHISSNAVKIALGLFDSKMVRAGFQKNIVNAARHHLN